MEIFATHFFLFRMDVTERNSAVEELVKRENIEKGVGVEATHNDTSHYIY